MQRFIPSFKLSVIVLMVCILLAISAIPDSIQDNTNQVTGQLNKINNTLLDLQR